MRDPERIDEMVDLVHALWDKYPEWRLAQLVLNAHAAASAPDDSYSVEDDVLERGLRILLSGPPDDGDRISKAA